MTRRKEGVDHIEEAGGTSIKNLFPEKAGENELLEILHEKVEPQHHEMCWRMARMLANRTNRAFALTAAALVMRELYEPNAAYGMFPYLNVTTNAAVASGATLVLGNVYQLGSYIGGVLQAGGAVNFTKGQRFFGLLTGPMDSNAGFRFVGNTVKLASDAISGIETDTSFANWRPEVVQARMIKGEYEGFNIVSETIIPFTAQVYLPAGGGVPAVAMYEGLSVRFWDSRCLNKELSWMDRNSMSYEDIVADLVSRAEAGKIPRRLLSEYVPEHLRRGRR